MKSDNHLRMRCLLAVLAVLVSVTIQGQRETPVPGGKQPFYVNHYGCATGHYLLNPKDYEEPYTIFAKADRQGKLTDLGRDILHRLDLLCQEAKGREGEMTAEGGKMMRTQVQQLVMQFPTMFTPDTYVDIRSVMQNHCIQMANEVGVEMARHFRSDRISVKASHKNQPWLNAQDKDLLAEREDSLTKERYNRFTILNSGAGRLMRALFNDQNYVVANIDAPALSQQLYILSQNIRQTELGKTMTLDDLFDADEMQRHLRRQNAWNYICYGNCTLNGGNQPYIQREPLWNMMHMGDSIMKNDYPVFNLRYTNQGVMLAMASLMELDNCGVATANLDSLEALGWLDNNIAPPGGSIMMIHYRRDKNDDDPLIKVMFNGHEARLPFKSDCAPYYHWNDVKRYYLRKLYRYEKARQDELEKKR